MKSLLVEEKIKYTGEQLRSAWLKDSFELEGNAIAAFQGECEVNEDFMVDLDDIKNKEFIYSEDMVHFIAEVLDLNLERMVAVQRILIVIIKEVLEEMVSGLKLKRSGDDLYQDDKKLSVSIATLSPVSSLIHVGVNVSSENTPVKTCSLNDFNIDPKMFSEKVLVLFVEEWNSMEYAKGKVKSVK
jgi:uncharacterized protein